MFQISSLITAFMVALSGVTLWQLWTRRTEIASDDIRDEERALAWRVVLFLVMPLLVAFDLRATELATTWAGGWLKDVDWNGWWYSALPQELASVDFLIPVLFAGVVAQFVFGLSLLPSLAFRPHPFVACVIVYLVAAIFALNLIVDPLAALVGCGSYRWSLALTSAPSDQVMMLVSTYLALSVVLLLCVKNKTVRLWFAELSRPHVGEQLRIAMCETRAQPHNELQIARLITLLDKAGLRTQAGREMSRLRRLNPHSRYLLFLEGYLAYRGRRFRRSITAFDRAAESITEANHLRATFLGAAACSAFGSGDMEKALNYASRALEFDERCVVARLVKVDVYLRTGKKQQAGEEVLSALRFGADDMDVEEKLPCDPELVLRTIERLERLPVSPEREVTVSRL